MQHDKLHKYVNVKASVNFRVKIKKKIGCKNDLHKNMHTKNQEEFLYCFSLQIMHHSGVSMFSSNPPDQWHQRVSEQVQYLF